MKPADWAARAAPAPPSPKPPPSRLRAALPLAILAAGLLLLAAVVLVGWLASQALRGQERYRIAFADIECTPPPHLTRAEFLDEVQYFAGMPDAVCVLDDGLPARLSAAFAKHPWVARVEAVEIVAPKRVRVRLTYRTAALRVPGPGAVWEAVDANGVRLPHAAVEDGLPELRGDVPPPAGQEGRPWGDDGVQAAARTAALLRPHQDQLNLRIIEIGPDGLVLRGDAWRALWARPAPSRWARRRRMPRCGGCSNSSRSPAARSWTCARRQNEGPKVACRRQGLVPGLGSSSGRNTGMTFSVIWKPKSRVARPLNGLKSLSQ